jgi:hypothetical protein
MLIEDSLKLPEDSFMDRLTDLQNRIGRDVHYKDQWGRDPQDSEDSDNGKSDETMEKMWELDVEESERKREAIRLRMEKGKERGVKADKGKDKKRKINRKGEPMKGGGAKKEEEKQSRIDDARLPQKSARKQPLELDNDHASDRMEIDEPVAPVAGPSGHNSRPQKPIAPPADDPLPAHLPRASSPPLPELTSTVLELSSDDSDREAPKKKAKRPSKPTAPPPPASKVTSTASTTTSAPTRGKGKAKARQSMEQAIQEAQKIKPDELRNHFPDISSFIDHLSSFELDRPGKLLQGCRILFVNADHWKVNGGIGGGGTRNRLDQGLRLEMGIVARQGATIVKPEDFVPSPQEANATEMTEEEIGRRAEEEGWTTHIVGYHPSNFRPPTFEEVLSCLGSEQTGMTAAELGPFVKVIRFSWVSDSVKSRKKTSEWEFAIQGDPREVPSSRVSSNKSSPTKKNKAKSARDRRPGKKRGPDDGGDTTGESLGEDDDGMPNGAIS